MDDQLRATIGRLVKDGGRLNVDSAAGGTSLVLDQPGSRFGILEVSGRVVVAGTDQQLAAELVSMGWSDPTVTLRLGREIRLPRADPDAEGSITLTRTWRVPPSLAAEIADSVRDAIGEVGRVEFLPLATRASSVVADARVPRPAIEEDDIDDPDEGRATRRTVPAQLKGLLVVALVAVVALAWTGLIRGAPRLPADAGEPSPTAVGAGAPAAASEKPSAPPSPKASPSEPIRSHITSASTEDDTWPATAAVDGNPLTAWHAAFGVPQWIEIGLDVPATVREIVLLIAQSEDGPTRHMIQVASTGQPLQVVGVVDRQTTDGDALVFRPDTPIENVERIRIETLASPSNAGWYEVILR